MTDLDIYQPPAGGQLAMTPEAAKALDSQLRTATRAVLREGTDYGIIPGTGGDQVLFRPGAQKLLQWFGLGFTCERVEVERDDEGRKHGITYRATVTRRLPDGTYQALATCEGTADYDEDKFFQSVEQVRAKLRDREHKYAAKDRRVPNADRWNDAKEYRAPWNTLMKRAQKRAIVGATIDATAAGGIFSQDREEDDQQAAAEGAPTWYEEALEVALTFTTVAEGQALWREAAAAARDGVCRPDQATHIQNRIKQRIKTLQAAVAVDVEDVAQAAADSSRAAEDSSGPAAVEENAGPEPTDDEERHTRLVGAVQGHMKRLGFTVDDTDREERLWALAKLAGLAYDGEELTSTSDFSEGHLKRIADTLAKCRDRGQFEVALTWADAKADAGGSNA